MTTTFDFNKKHLDRYGLFVTSVDNYQNSIDITEHCISMAYDPKLLYYAAVNYLINDINFQEEMPLTEDKIRYIFRPDQFQILRLNDLWDYTASIGYDQFANELKELMKIKE